MIVVLRRTVVGGDDWHFENLSRSHHQGQSTLLMTSAQSKGGGGRGGGGRGGGKGGGKELLVTLYGRNLDNLRL